MQCNDGREHSRQILNTCFIVTCKVTTNCLYSFEATVRNLSSNISIFMLKIAAVTSKSNHFEASGAFVGPQGRPRGSLKILFGPQGRPRGSLDIIWGSQERPRGSVESLLGPQGRPRESLDTLFGPQERPRESLETLFGAQGRLSGSFLTCLH